MQLRNAQTFLGTVLLLSAGFAACSDVPQHRNEDDRFSSADSVTADTGGKSTDTTVDEIRRPFSSEDPVAPEIAGKTIDGSDFSLSSLHGRVVVVNFWATWCAPCRVEIPAFVRLQTELQSQGLQFVGISVDEGDLDPVRSFAKELGVNYPILLASPELIVAYDDVPALPTTYVIDRAGRIRQRFVGEVDRETLHPVLSGLLAEASPPGE